jgi:hypothetical protein
MVTGVALLSVGSYAWMHMRHVPEPLATPIAVRQPKAENTLSKPESEPSAATIPSPLANYAQKQEAPNPEKIQTITYTPPTSDHVYGPVVGTSTVLLRQTFVVAGTVDLPFDVPAHTYNPHLHGVFRSFTHGGGGKLSEGAADVEFVVLSDGQFSDFVNGRPGAAIFTADAAHEEEVNTNLPPTLAAPARYHLIFRNGSRASGKKLVQADFRIEY